MVGTATLIGKDLLLSCAHCVWKPLHDGYGDGGYADTIEFYVGGNSTNSIASASSVDVTIDDSYINNVSYTYEDGVITGVTIDYQYDWSIIQIDEDLGSLYGTYEVEFCTTVDSGQDIYTIGYPNDMPEDTQWMSEGELLSFNGKNFNHSAYTVNGNSGGPIIGVGNQKIKGIHSSSVTNSNGWLYSLGVRIYGNLYIMISNMIDESEERWE